MYKTEDFKQVIGNFKQLAQYISYTNALQSTQSMFRIPLFIGDDIEISVGVYTVARRTTKTAAISIDSSSNQEAKRSTNFIDTNTGEILLPSDIKLMQVVEIETLDF